MASSSVVGFPHVRKRGAKVKRGPCASILAFPAMLSGDELGARWAWLWGNHQNWRHEDTEGAYDDPAEWQGSVNIRRGLAPMYGDSFDERDMRRDVEKFVGVIKKRTEVKDWLEELGVDWDSVKSAEDALNFVADKFRAPSPRGGRNAVTLRR